ncbi:CHAT domain-containing protein [Kordia periserrulae]|uniref:CHAT domain-containing protein n=1 Tax=Kordia periserrulae TaxID=701523 RepID=A0A2T6C1G7_9FLAO|nr:CHAT domain-containing protein [Kordia periserrulae]PTX62087.1 CHAT domain-containing protein [Kordia periserrulae]
MNILFIKANPIDSDALRLDVEENAIRDVLDSCDDKTKFDFESRGAVTKDLLIDHLLKIKPNILHISGHGNTEEQLLLEDVDGYKEEVSIEKLSNVLSGFTDHIQCVFLNTCHSLSGMGDFNENIAYIIGMKNEIPDEVAISFSRNFYNALFNGRTIKDSFKIALSRIAMTDQGDEYIPKLIVNKKAIAATPIPKEAVENDEDELINTIISEAEIAEAKNGYQQSINFHYKIIFGAIAISVGLFLFLYFSGNNDLTSSLIGLIPSAFGSYPFLEIQKRKNRITLIRVFELKRQRLLNALSQLSPTERRELNDEFKRLIII